MNYTEEDVRDAFRAGKEKGAYKSYFDQPLDEDEFVENLKKQERPKEELFIWDGINCSLEEVDSIEDAKEFIKENFIEGGEIHPDIESVFIVQKIASVYVDETGESTNKNGDIIPLCQIIIN